MRSAFAVAVAVASTVLAAAPAAAAERYAIIITGAAGSAEHATQHGTWRDELAAALRGSMKMPPGHIHLLGDVVAERKAQRTVADDVDVSSRDQVRAAFARLAPVLEKDDLLLVVLIGHATFDGVDAKFNLVGPDLEAADWKALVSPIRGKVVFVNTAAASAPFLSRLAGERRIVVTATDSGVQRYETVFPRFFVQAFADAETDLDKDSRISVWEAFARASLGVRQYYRQKGQLTVEKPVLDDTGDGVGKDAGATGPDGAIASRTFFDDADDPARAGGPALSELVARRNALESELDELKKRKDFMRLAEYEKRRDEVIIEIARVSRKIRTEQAGRS
jgi:hypothetical protein